MGCQRCREYEQAVMDRAPDGPEPPAPCDHFAMSPRFRAWVVGRMQAELKGQVSLAGLDRMALVKAPKKP